MGDYCVECLVSRDKNMLHYALRMTMYVLAGVCALLAIIGIAVALVGTVVFAALGAFVCPDPEIEFEYLFLGREISVDKIIAKSKRKTVGTYDIDKIEFVCPINSHQLDNYKSRKVPVTDYSSCKPEARIYAIAYRGENGDALLYIEPNDELFAAMKGVMPRKISEY